MTVSYETLRGMDHSNGSELGVGVAVLPPENIQQCLEALWVATVGVGWILRHLVGTGPGVLLDTP